MSDNGKVLVPIYRPSRKSTRIGKAAAKRIKAGESTTSIGKEVAAQIKKG